ncbi:hypothetical protein [Mycobacteroides abscessus]|uniref:hypothetical protein n=1 Tax=Mycobacteroides abscessus TaxID=36809 RepID=UPI0009A85308|nr:hypothetical protein [Mycobacteroides abscessus]SKK31432.1 Uncharacterised protein [Mycobacteroides abscessus subsp. abscessus]
MIEEPDIFWEDTRDQIDHSFRFEQDRLERLDPVARRRRLRGVLASVFGRGTDSADPRGGAAAVRGSRSLEARTKAVRRRVMDDWKAVLEVSVPAEVASSFPVEYSGRELVEALGSTGLLDTSAMPTALKDKRVRRGESADNRDAVWVVADAVKGTDALRTSEANRTPVIPLWLIRSGGILAGLISLWGLIAVVAITTGVQATAMVENIYLVLGAALLGAGGLTGLTYAGYRVKNRELEYSPLEVQQLAAATVDWPGRAGLTAYPNGQKLLSEWDSRWGKGTGEVGAAAVVWREAYLVAVANRIAKDIRASAAWGNELCDEQRVRIDLDSTLRDIRRRAHLIWRVDATTVWPAENNPQRDLVVARNKDMQAAAAVAWDSLVALVAQLRDYYTNQLTPIDALLADIAKVTASQTWMPDAAVLQLHIDAAGNDLRREDIAAAAGALQDLRADLSARFAFLRQTLTDENNMLQTLTV